MSGRGGEDRLFDIDVVPTVTKPLQLPYGGHRDVQTRNFGGWTLDKLSLLTLYLKQYRKVAGSGTYLDGFAGSGAVTVNGITMPGSAAIGRNSGAFRDVRLYEMDPGCLRQLKIFRRDLPELARARTTIRAGDMNARIAADLNRQRIDRRRPCFAFLDPNSTQLAWETIDALAGYKKYDPGDDPKHPRECKVELWILFNTHQALARLVPKERGPEFATSGNAAALDHVMGGRAAWSDLLDTGFSYGSLLKRYAENISRLGYALVRWCVIRDPATGRPQYYMVHASDHPSAHSMMYWAQNEHLRETGRTAAMFNPDDPPRPRTSRG